MQELAMWVGGVLPRPSRARPCTQLNDAQKATNHGMDKDFLPRPRQRKEVETSQVIKEEARRGPETCHSGLGLPPVPTQPWAGRVPTGRVG
ncbi:hypothetical protein Tasa_034_003 [Tanticharoenia sakaeratensis NBRC 103193]|uniref:Uncharacterized protein n=1 Tax=Tanticharoenia sakaeratensis NBRC 103193 TaxID=1231623 RepID=A0A0D6MMM4_9PROT|nr:hypothetical protein Tasa_034_003 [Tanticharoenia sakaeratensis NBRC 103193]